MSQLNDPWAVHRGGRWCPGCAAWAVNCPVPDEHGNGWIYDQRPPRQRSVVGTTLLVLLTVFVIAPILLLGACSVLDGGLGMGS